MLELLGLPVVAIPLVIFFLRMTDVSLDTLRLLFVIRGRRPIAWILGFIQSLLWVTAITTVLTNLDNLLNVVGYAGGFATGTVVGITIEGRLAIGHGHMRIISSRRGRAIADAIREAGYAATEIPGRGKDGTVSLINSSVRRRDVQTVRAMVSEIDPDAFVTVEEVRPLHRGFWRG